MLRQLRVTGLVLVGLLAAATGAMAQSGKYLYLGAGMTMPMGDYKEYAKTGWMGSIGLGTDLGSSGSLFGFVDGFFGKNSHDDEGDSTTLMGGGLNLGVQSQGGPARVYGYAGLGMQNHKYNTTGVGDGASETKPYARGAVGLSLGSGKTTFWVELGMLQGFGGDGGNTAYMPILAGISIGL